MTAKPLPNWDITLNYSKSNPVSSNIFPRIGNYIDRNWSTWSASSSLQIGETDKTIQSYLDEIQTQYAYDKLAEGMKTVSSREHTVNMFTNYRFTDGKLAGFSVGGGMRWRSKQVTGFEDTADANSNIYYGDSLMLFDLKMGYKNPN